MKALTYITVIAFSAILQTAASADTIISFVEREGAVDVFIDPDPDPQKRKPPNRTVAGESADTVNLRDPETFNGPLGRRLCGLNCVTGLFGAALFEPNSSEISDFIVANVIFGGAPGAVDSDYSFASDPDILTLARKFQLEGRPNAGLDLLNVLLTKVPKTFEKGEEQTLQFFDLNGQLTPLPSGIPFPPFFTGGAIVIKATSDISEVPEPTTLLLVGTMAVGLGLARWRQWKRKQQP
jgi:hypothetical protein